jgi:hypothetical protein
MYKLRPHKSESSPFKENIQTQKEIEREVLEVWEMPNHEQKTDN